MKQLAFALILLLLLPSCIHENPSSPQTPEPASSQVAAPSSSLPSSASSSASSSAFTGPYAADPGPDDPRSLVDQETLQWVWTFLQYFYATPFEDPSEIPARDVYWFAFTQIARDAWYADSQQVMADLEKNNQAFPIPREVAEEMIAKTFGLEDLPYEGDVAYKMCIRDRFKCVLDGKQCAVMVPTTILAWQHYQTFLRRLEGYPVTVELLSRDVYKRQT